MSLCSACISSHLWAGENDSGCPQTLVPSPIFSMPPLSFLSPVLDHPPPSVSTSEREQGTAAAELNPFSGLPLHHAPPWGAP